MRTTLAIDDELLAAAKRRARAQGLTLGQVVEAALRRELALAGPGGAPRPEVPVFTGTGGVVEGVDLTSNRSITEALDEGRDLDELR